MILFLECNSNLFKCTNGECIDLNKKCNHIYDCTDASDETGCHYCASNQFTCGDGSCIDAYYRCDRRMDCKDGSDEASCEQQGIILIYFS